jgi:hypothetical protein
MEERKDRRRGTRTTTVTSSVERRTAVNMAVWYAISD